MPKVKKRSSLEDGKEAMPQLRNIHHFVARLYSHLSARATGRLVHTIYTSTNLKTRPAKFAPATTKVAKPKCVGGIETEAKPLGKANGQAHSCLPDMNSKEGIKTVAMKIRATNKN